MVTKNVKYSKVVGKCKLNLIYNTLMNINKDIII